MARLRVDFSQLHAAVEQMGAAEVHFALHIHQDPIEPIDLKLQEGLEVPLDEIDYQSGLLSYEGRQILLYIKDHGSTLQKAVANGADGKRFHVADCKTLQDMRARNRFDRYYVTNNLSGEFEITGYDYYSNSVTTGTARLKVCINCLKKLNYKGYVSGARAPRKTIWEPFSINEFFKQYSSCFKYLPHHDVDDDAQYTEDWPVIAGRFKAKRNFKCQLCRVDLSEHRELLHVHHINGVKNDNRQKNLVALCIDCHRKQDSHEHMFVSHKQMQLITHLRREQSIGRKGTWDKVIQLADPAVEGVLLQCRAAGAPLPEVGYEVQNMREEVVAELELAWPKRLIGIALVEEDKTAAEKEGWTVWEMIEVLDRYPVFQRSIGR